MDFQVIFSERALKDLAEITTYIARDNPGAAFELADKLVTLASGLSRFPLRHPKDFHRPGTRKMPAPPYLIYYVVNENESTVVILHFWHGARQHPIP